ncbi:CaiF/GrlA family transcriptional regulator [Citrobacter europaeus]|uniref:CaiF/GrlA family transcriptional regulator n=1 Tax=Citrobacter europaeus TaxID=1914243 RepID=UPI0039C167B1
MLNINNRRKGKIIQPAGIKDTPWILPAEVCWLGEPALWLAVAWWARLNERPVSITEISSAFGVNMRRAGDAVSYIINSCKNNVKAEVFVQGIPGGGRTRFIHVHEVMMTSGVQPRDSVSSATARVDTRAMIKEEREFLSALGRFFLHGGKKTKNDISGF